MNNNATTKFFIYFSEILGKEVFDFNNRCVGRLFDVVMKVNGEIYPKAVNLVIKKGFFKKYFACIGWENLAEVDEIIKLKIGPGQITFQQGKPKQDFTLCTDILDQQIVDTHNQKVVRVNDVHLLRVDNQLYLAHVDVGIRGLVRRLEWTGLADRIVKFFSPRSSYLMREDLISWKNAQVFTLGRTKNLLRLDVAREKLAQMHPTELAEIIKDLGKHEKSVLFKSLDTVLQRKVFADMATTEQVELIELLDDKEAVSLLENIPSDDAADLLLKLRRRKTLHLMKLMETKTSKKLSKLLKFAKDSAGGLMTTEYLSLPQNALVKDALEKVRENVEFPGNIYYIFLVDGENHLIGWTSLRWFINADPEKPLIETCHPQKIFVQPEDKIEKVAVLFEKYKFAVLPVVNEANVLQGVITGDDVMEELISIAWKKYKEKL